MRVDPIGLGELDAFTLDSADGVGHRESGRNAHELEVAPALSGRDRLERLGTDARARVGLGLRSRTFLVLHEHFIGNEIVSGADRLLSASAYPGERNRETGNER